MGWSIEKACCSCKEEPKEGVKLRRCTRCQTRVAKYCSVKCQRKHWLSHKFVCGKEDACPLCLERFEHDGDHAYMCFSCGFMSCEECRGEWTRGCPRCNFGSSGGGSGRLCAALFELLRKKPTGTHVAKAHYWIGRYHETGAEGATRNVDEAERHFRIALDMGVAEAGVLLVQRMHEKSGAPDDEMLGILEKSLVIDGRYRIADTQRRKQIEALIEVKKQGYR